jgi:CheY-like chemotaxis protein
MQKKRILVIEDDDMSREGVAEILTDEGYEVMAASNGVEGLALLSTYQPDIVLTDLHMPKLDGWGVIEYLKQTYPLLPVLIFTSDIEIDVMRKAKSLGVQDFINKPFRLDDLIRRVKRVLPL